MARTQPHTLTFRISCWIMGIVAFVQLVVAGLALAMRMEATREVKVVEKVVTQIVAAPKPEPIAAPRIEVDRDPLPDLPAVVSVPLPPPRNLETPAIADPVTEKLVKEARNARISEDMMSAVTKLEQALQSSPNEPNALYELGLVHEAMGIYDRATQYYHKVFELGTTGAGSLYLKASEKLKDGFEQPQDKVNRIVLGRARVFKDTREADGERVVVTIPVQSIAGEEIEGRDLEVLVNFFDEIGARKEIAPADTSTCKVDYKWVTEPVDWHSGEELLQVTYVLPAQDQQQQHLFGEKRYYGQVVELSYKGELIDSQAWPRILARKLNKPDASPVFLDKELPPGYNQENPLLPNVDPSSIDPMPLPSYDKARAANQLPPPPADLPPDDGMPLPVPPEYRHLPKH